MWQLLLKTTLSPQETLYARAPEWVRVPVDARELRWMISTLERVATTAREEPRLMQMEFADDRAQYHRLPEALLQASCGDPLPELERILFRVTRPGTSTPPCLYGGERDEDLERATACDVSDTFWVALEDRGYFQGRLWGGEHQVRSVMLSRKRALQLLAALLLHSGENEVQEHFPWLLERSPEAGLVLLRERPEALGGSLGAAALGALLSSAHPALRLEAIRVLGQALPSL